jgi:hypothetical protein
MKLKKIFMRILIKPERHSSLFSEALTEAFLDMFKEMGYKFNRKQ